MNGDRTSLQPSHVGIQNSIYFYLKKIKGSILSYTRGLKTKMNIIHRGFRTLSGLFMEQNWTG